MSGCHGKVRLSSIAQSGGPGIGRLLSPPPPGELDLFRDVPTRTIRSDPISAPPAHDPVSILDSSEDLPDSRRQPGRIHRLDEIVFLATGAGFSGADNGVPIADDADSQIDGLQTVLTWPGGIPSHDTFGRVFCRLDPVAFPKGFSAGMTALMARQGLTPRATEPPELTPMAIDGKAPRGAARRTVGPSALPGSSSIDACTAIASWPR
jgi:hypothetical protein